MAKEKVASVLTIQAPGAMTRKGRAAIARWLYHQGRNLVRYGDGYTEKTFRARYLYK